ncbi:MAG: pectinesterase family protein [Bacteroidales bacterium]|nr:pectinesterase family protein [Bacteroidales bacterium]
MKNFNRLTLLLILVVTCIMAKAQPNAPDIVVSKNGKGQFTSIQEAVLSVRDYKPTRTTIYVKEGVYNEKVIIPANKCDITIIGEGVDKVKIVYSDYASLNNMGTFNTWTVRVDGTGIRMENLTIENAAGRVGQAVALHVEGDRCEFANVKLLGNQDTLYTGGTACSRQYYCNCYIEGTTDFIFGPATAWFEGCEIFCKADSYITAASTPDNVPYGYIFNGCKIKSDVGVKKVYLGRPWRAYASVTFLNCEMPESITPEGWHNWGRVENQKSARYAEHNSMGPGAKSDARVDWSKQLTDAEAEAITMDRVMQFRSDWKPAY